MYVACIVINVQTFIQDHVYIHVYRIIYMIFSFLGSNTTFFVRAVQPYDLYEHTYIMACLYIHNCIPLYVYVSE